MACDSVRTGRASVRRRRWSAAGSAGAPPSNPPTRRSPRPVGVDRQARVVGHRAGRRCARAAGGAEAAAVGGDGEAARRAGPPAALRVPDSRRARPLRVGRHRAAAMRAGGDLPAIGVHERRRREGAPAVARARRAPCRGRRPGRPCARAPPRCRRARPPRSTRQHTQVSPPRAWSMPLHARAPLGHARDVGGASGARPRGCRSSATSTVPSAATARSVERVRDRPVLVHAQRRARSVRPPSSERDRRRSDANSVPSGLGLADDQRRRPRRPAPTARPGAWWSESTDESRRVDAHRRGAASPGRRDVERVGRGPPGRPTRRSAGRRRRRPPPAPETCTSWPPAGCVELEPRRPSVGRRRPRGDGQRRQRRSASASDPEVRERRALISTSTASAAVERAAVARARRSAGWRRPRPPTRRRSRRSGCGPRRTRRGSTACSRSRRAR